jgi:hypothetical protein
MHGESVYEGHSGIDEMRRYKLEDKGSSLEDREYGDVQERPLHITQTSNANRRASQKELTSSFN